jgi:hypothetical protein
MRSPYSSRRAARDLAGFRLRASNQLHTPSKAVHSEWLAIFVSNPCVIPLLRQAA